MTRLDRRSLLAGAALAGTVGAAPFLAETARAAADDGPFAAHPEYRFVLVARDTTDPFFVATQYGAADAAKLLGCRYEWKGSGHATVPEAVAALEAAVESKADGIAVSITDPAAFGAALGRARSAGIPVVAFESDLAPREARLGSVVVDGERSGEEIAGLIARLVPQGPVSLLAADPRSPRVAAVRAGLRRAGVPAVMVEAAKEGAVARHLERPPGARGVFALDRPPTRELVSLVKAGRVRPELRAGGADLLPATLELVEKGRLAFTLDDEPYLQGFLPLLQLFLARVSGGLTGPADVRLDARVVTRRAAGRYLKARTRFEGSSSRHAPVS